MHFWLKLYFLGVETSSVYGFFGFFGLVYSVWNLFRWKQKAIKTKPLTELWFDLVMTITKGNQILRLKVKPEVQIF